MQTRCPYCFTDLDERETAVRCSRCATPHHQACFLEHGRCVTLMCGSVAYRTVQGLELQARRHVEVVVGPARFRFHVRGGHVYGDPQWLDVVASPPELSRVAAPRIDVALAGASYRPGDEVRGEVALHLPAAIRARGVRLVLRAEQAAPGGHAKTLLDREALLAGFVWEGHLRAFGLAARSLLRMEREDELIWLVGGITRWTFAFRLDALHAAHEGVASEVLAYVDIPAAHDSVGRAALPISRPKTLE